jgi:hypothetical protein
MCCGPAAVYVLVTTPTGKALTAANARHMARERKMLDTAVMTRRAAPARAPARTSAQVVEMAAAGQVTRRTRTTRTRRLPQVTSRISTSMLTMPPRLLVLSLLALLVQKYKY